MKGHYINGRWQKGTSATFKSFDSATQTLLWEGQEGSLQDVDAAVTAAKAAFPIWSNFDINKRISYLETYHQQLSNRKEHLAVAISKENGKPLWDAKTEVSAMLSKIGISIEAYNLRCPHTRKEQPNGELNTRHRPHGVMAVFGPFNFPGHLPNGQIVPALLAGNTIVFKPSELTPLVAEMMLECWEQCALPAGAINMIQGGRETGKYLSQHPDLDGLLFTGSWLTGKMIAEQMASAPHKILALEMGGNNPYLIGNINDLKAAAYLTIQSAFLTSGQRCTCARRLIIPKGKKGDEFLNALVEMTKTIRVGSYKENPEPFMGPVISKQAAEKLLQRQSLLISSGGRPLLKMETLKQGPAFLSPGIIDVTSIAKRMDEEIFGPLLQVIRVDDLTAGIKEANNTQYGLTAGILSNDPEEYKAFYKGVKAGVINWNASLTGTSSNAPFGGVKHSGNNRPSALYAADFCAYPVASLETPSINMPPNIAPGIEL